MKLRKTTKLSKLVEKYPEATEVFIKNGMHCFGCAAASFETVEQGCEAHGLDADKLIKELDKIINKKK